MTEKIRINKYLADKGESTRKGADDLIKQGLVFINDKLAVLGDKVSPADKVEVKRQQKPEYIYLAYNKPKGVVTHSADDDEKDIGKLIGRKGIFPVGRLDKDSVGLIILTNDGRITDRLLSPDKEHEKVYRVTVEKTLRPTFLNKLASGVNIEGYKTRPAKTREVNEKMFEITLTEGKKHQIRRMCAALGYTVKNLKRIKIMNIELGSLKSGQTRTIKGEELKTFLKNLGLK